MRSATFTIPCVIVAAGISACSGSESAPDAPRAVTAPTITAPVSNAMVASPLDVEGTADPGLRVSVTLSQSDMTLATASAVTNANGRWETTLTFAAASGAVSLTAVAVDDGRRSTLVDRNLTVSTGTMPGPTPPVLTAPAQNDTVYGAIDVRGTGAAGAAVSVVVKHEDTSLAGEVVVVGESGTFAVTVDYGDAPAPGQTLTVEVTQMTDGGRSEPAVIEVRHGQRTAVAGTVRDPTGHPGSAVYVHAYPVGEDGLKVAAEARLSADDGMSFEGLVFDFDLAPGRYVFRAFRDAGSRYGLPDGEPTLGIDAQSAGTEVIVTTDSAPAVTLAINAAATAVSAPHFDVYTRHESSVPYPPFWNNEMGQGLCGGFYLRMEVNQAGAEPPRVRLPDGTIATLLDDGGCGEAADNTALSYDHLANDGQFSYGIRSPGPEMAGDYRFAARDAPSGQIDVQIDNIAQITRLSRRVVLQTPTGAARVTSLRPTIDWLAVPDAESYRVNIWGPDTGGDSLSTSDTSYALTNDLSDGGVYEVRIDAADGDRLLGDDIDAEAFGIANRFVVDVSGSRSVIISGTIVNERVALNAPILVEAGANDAPASNVWLAPTETAFSLVVPNGASEGYVEAFLDVDGSGDDDGPNREHRTKVENIDLTTGTPTPVELRFRPRIDTVSPVVGAVLNETQPTFTWRPFTPAPPNPWSWAVYISANDGSGDSDGPPANLYGLAPGRTSLSLAMLGATRDIGLLARCAEEGGIFDFVGWTCDTPVEASAGSLTPGAWRWGVAIIPCDFSAADYGTCLGAHLTSEPELRSVEVDFQVQ